jgi:hypothetical protein
VSFFIDANDPALLPVVGDGLLPGDIDGKQKPMLHAKIPLVGTQDDGGVYGATFDAVNIWDLAVKWRSTPTASLALNAQLPVAAFDSIFPCGPTSRDCLPQPGVTNPDQYLDMLSYRQRLRRPLSLRVGVWRRRVCGPVDADRHGQSVGLLEEAHGIGDDLVDRDRGRGVPIAPEPIERTQLTERLEVPPPLECAHLPPDLSYSDRILCPVDTEIVQRRTCASIGQRTLIRGRPIRISRSRPATGALCAAADTDLGRPDRGCRSGSRSIRLDARRSSSVVEQGTHKPLVGGSNPPSATKPSRRTSRDPAPSPWLVGEPRRGPGYTRRGGRRAAVTRIRRHR